MSHLRYFGRVALATLALTGLATCGGDSGGSSPTTPAAPAPAPLTPLSWLDVPTEVVSVSFENRTRVLNLRLSAAVEASITYTYDEREIEVEGVVLRPGVVQLTITGLGRASPGESTIKLVAEAPGYQTAEASFLVRIEEVEIESTRDFYVLVKVVVEYYWEDIFAENSEVYSRITVFEGYTPPGFSPCGELGPENAFYCPANAGVYYHAAFLDGYFLEIGPMASAYIIGHEIGHHVSWELDWIPGVNLSRKQSELQADCFAGAWAGASDAEFELAPEDLAAATAAVLSVGQPEETWFNPDLHGTGKQRLSAFGAGFDEGPSICTDPSWLAQFPLTATETLPYPVGDGARELDLPHRQH